MNSSVDRLAAGNLLPRELRSGERYATVVVVRHPDCGVCAAYVTQLSSEADIAAWDARVVEVHDVDNDAPRVIIADQWGEIAVVEHAGAAHRFMASAELITWLQYLAMKCPECEGEAL